MLNWKPEQQFRTNKNVIEVLNRCSKKMLKLSDVIGGGGGELEMKTWIALASDLQFFLWFSWQKADFVMAAEAPYLM